MQWCEAGKDAVLSEAKHLQSYVRAARLLTGKLVYRLQLHLQQRSDPTANAGGGPVFDLLEVPMKRRASQTVLLSRMMRGLGWSNIRARGLAPNSYRDRVRGYAREVPDHPATLKLPNGF